jgi:cytoskeletal protein RodZ
MALRGMKEPETIGERIRKRRESLGLSIKNVADDIQAHVRYIEALENDTYDVFSAKIYALGFLKKVLTVLTFKDTERILKEFDNEWNVRTYRVRDKIIRVPENRGDRPYVTPRRLGIITAIVIGILVLVFLGLRLLRFVQKPQFLISTPKDQAVIDRPVVRVSGMVEKESQLTVNGRELTVAESSNFDEDVELQVGVNKLRFVVVDRFGKENVIMRYIFVK